MAVHHKKGIARPIQLILFFVFVAAIIGFVAWMAVNEQGDVNQFETSSSASSEIESSQETSSEPEEPKTTQVSLVAVGDNLMHDTVIDGGLQPDGTYNYDSYFQNIKPDIEQADVAIINQETILGGASLGYSGYPCFNSPQEMGDTLVRMGFDVVQQASNHSMDKGYQGIQNAIDYWKTSHPEIMTLGLNETPEEQNEISVMEKNGIKMAFLNYTYGLNGIPLPEDKPYLVDMLDKEKMAQDIAKAKTMADVVIVLPHWGTEYVYEPDSMQQEYTTFFAEQGVDIVIGTHPHVVEPVEWVTRPDGKQMLVYYSLGNLISCQDRTPRMLGGMARITIQKTGEEISITNAGITPLVTHYESRSNWNFGVYKLNEYTQELASRHGMRRHDSSFSLEELNSLAQQVLGDFIQYPTLN